MFNFRKMRGNADTAVLSLAVYCVCTGLYIYGIVHAFDVHSIGTGVVTLIIPPLGFLFGLEAIFMH